MPGGKQDGVFDYLSACIPYVLLENQVCGNNLTLNGHQWESCVGCRMAMILDLDVS